MNKLSQKEFNENRYNDLKLFMDDVLETITTEQFRIFKDFLNVSLEKNNKI